MSGFLVGTALVLASVGITMLAAPQIVTNRSSLEPLPAGPASHRIFQIGGGVLLALAALLVTQSFS